MKVRQTATMLAVADLDRSIGFYCDKLPFELLERQEHIAFLRLGSSLLHLFTASPPTKDKPGVTLAPPSNRGRLSAILVLKVDDCGAAYRELTARGAAFLTPPQVPPWGGERCFLHDPDGHLVEIEEEP